MSYEEQALLMPVYLLMYAHPPGKSFSIYRINLSLMRANTPGISVRALFLRVVSETVFDVCFRRFHSHVENLQIQSILLRASTPGESLCERFYGIPVRAIFGGPLRRAGNLWLSNILNVRAHRQACGSEGRVSRRLCSFN